MNSNKRKFTPLIEGVSKQLRSKLLRRKRQQFSPLLNVETEVSDCSCVVSEPSRRNVEEVSKEEDCVVAKKDAEVSDSSCVVSEPSRRNVDCCGEVHADVSDSVSEGSRRNGIEVAKKDSYGEVKNSVSEGSRRDVEVVKKASRRNGVEVGEIEVAKKDCYGEGTVELSDSSCVVSKNSVSEGSRRNEIEVAKKDAEVSDCSFVVSNSVSEASRRDVKGIEVAKKDCFGEGTVEVSDCSCVVSNSVVEVSRRNGKSVKGESKEVANSVVSVDSVKFNCRGMFESASDSVILNLNDPKLCDENEEFEVESGVQKPGGGFGIENVDVVSIDSVKLSTEETVSFPGMIVAELDLECSENFSNDDLKNEVVSVDSSAYSSVYFESSEFESLSDEYSDSTWYNSGSQFSEKSDPDGYPSRTFQLLNEFSLQFYRSSLFENSSHKLITNDFSSNEVTLLGLENDEDEENYRMLKSRERRQMYLRDYAAEYCTTGNGQLIIEQRLEMVHWIFEHSTNMELQSETMFLGINLLDRFFSKGYFKTKRSLQLAGIACLTLATRIEENQPYNSIRQKTFYVGNTAYSRCEVVAMEWLVQEILNFQCFLPTMYNFLWFYLKAARANAMVGKTVGYLATLAMLSHEQMCYWPSTVAASLVILACKAAESDAHCHLLIESHSMEKGDSLPECIKRLEWLVKYC